MKQVICNFSLFDMQQTVYIFDDVTNTYEAVGNCTLEDLGKVVADVCFAHNINNVHLYGQSKFAESILCDIDTHSNCSAYSNGMILVEVN